MSKPKKSVLLETYDFDIEDDKNRKKSLKRQINVLRFLAVFFFLATVALVALGVLGL